MNIIDYVLKTNKTTQKALAAKLDVDVSQISKWKAGKSMSPEREEELISMVGLFGDDFQYALLVKTEKNSKAWIKYFTEVNAAILNSHDEINDMPDTYALIILCELSRFGVPIPASCSELDSDHPFKIMISNLLERYADIYQWMEITFTDPDPSSIKNLSLDLHDCQRNIELDGMLPKGIVEVFTQEENGDEFDILSQCNVDLSKYNQRKMKTQIATTQYIKDFCDEMISNNLPITKDYFEFQKFSSYYMGEETDEFHHGTSPQISNYYTHAEKTILNRLDWLEHHLIELKELKS